MSLGKAIDLVKAIQSQIEIHGESLEVGFYLSEEHIAEIKDLECCIGGVKLDGVEKQAAAPRLDLVFAD